MSTDPPASAPGATIIRSARDREHPYFLANRGTFQDTRLSWEARGLLAYLLSKPDNWEVRVADLVRQAPGALPRVQRILKELAAAGYVQRRRVPGAGGRFSWTTVVFETPSDTPAAPPPAPVPAPRAGFPSMAEPPMVEPSMAEPPMVQPLMENRPIYRVETSQNTELQNRERERASPPPSEGESFALTDELRAFAAAIAAEAGMPAAALDPAREFRRWQDYQRRQGAWPRDCAAGLRLWFERAVDYYLAHPPASERSAPHGPTGTLERRAEPPAAESAPGSVFTPGFGAALATLLGALPAPAGALDAHPLPEL